MFIVSGRLDSAQPTSYDIKLGLTAESSNPAVIPSYSVSSSFGYFADDLGTYSQISFAVAGAITTSALEPSTSLYFVAKDWTGSAGGDPITFSGNGVIQLVG